MLLADKLDIEQKLKVNMLAEAGAQAELEAEVRHHASHPSSHYVVRQEVGMWLRVGA